MPRIVVKSFLLLVLLLAVSGCSLLWPEGRDHDFVFEGTIMYVTIEGGAWVIKSDGGTTYEPINLSDEHKVESRRVRVWADEREDLVSYLMVGPIIEIERVRLLE